MNEAQQSQLDNIRTETLLMITQLQRETMETLLTEKKNRYYEAVLIASGTAGLMSICIAIAKLLLD